MDDILGIIAELTTGMSVDRAASVADAVGRIPSIEDFDRAAPAFGPNIERHRIDRLRTAWRAAPRVSPKEIAAAFRAASRVVELMGRRGSVELVWTGPKTGMIPTRHTEQVILEVIDSAESDLFVVSYVFYKTESIVKALDAATKRGVDVRILLECSIAHGGTVRGDSAKTMREAVPGATIYVWDQALKKSKDATASASVHAKCAVADSRLAFITSANLTSAAMERNMELGLLIRGGPVPDKLRQHLAALVTTKVIVEFK